jgi:C1A family cysteine protease
MRYYKSYKSLSAKNKGGLIMLKFALGSLVGIIFGIIATLLLIVYAYKQYKTFLKKAQTPPKRKYNCKKDHQDPRDFKFAASHYGILPLPASVDLRLKMSPVVEQGKLGSCTANAIASGLKEYLLLKTGEALIRLSRLFLYYFERELEGTIDEDSGAEIRDGMKVLQKIGVCPEVLWPYVIQIFDKKPSKQADKAAAQYKISAYHRIEDLDELKVALSEDHPVVFGFEVYESFESDQVAKTGIVSLPAADEHLLGGHAVLAVGYDDSKGWVIVRNSWGETWGDQGNFYMPYDVFNKLVMDMWTGQ